MDFGLSGFVEMFEKRFGQLPTTVLVALIGLALACLSIKTVVEIAILPFIGLVRDLATHSPVSWWSLLTQNNLKWEAAETIVAVVSAVVALKLWRMAVLRDNNAKEKYLETLATVEEELAEVKAVGKRLQTESSINPPAVSPPS
jgi:hypothetical protein